MILDSQLIFTGTAAAPLQTITATAASTNVYDATVAEDLGASGSGMTLNIACFVGTAFTTGNGGTLQVQFQGSVNNSVWTTYVETDVMAVSLLTANAKVFAVSWPHRSAGAAVPRYYRLNFVVGTGVMSAGTIQAAIVLSRDDMTSILYPSGFSVAS